MFNAIADASLPPASLAVLALLLFCVGGHRSRRLGILVTALLVILAVPTVSGAMLMSLAPPPEPPGAPPEAIVILSADAVRVAGPDEIDPGPLTFARIRQGAVLARETRLPVLVSGGLVLPKQKISLAAMMDRSMQRDLGVTVRWDEGESRDTWENAADSAAILRAAGISHIYLVTHPWHMRRALIAFRHFGLDATPAPVRPAVLLPFGVKQLIPRTFAWEDSYLAFHEWVGCLFYALRR